MKKIILIPDSFKGTMSSIEICNVMEKAIKNHFPKTEVVKIAVADGGEGSVDSFLLSMGGKKIVKNVKGPYFEEIKAFYGILDDNKTAIIEMASAAGLPLVGENRQAHKTTTFGVGELINDAVDKGIDKLIIGLGGSATNDGGCGAAVALGAKFYDENETEFIPVGETLKNIQRVDISKIKERLANIEVITMCDIDNTLCGEQGAAAVFGPQKGANPETVKLLDEGLYNLSQIVKKDLNVDILNVKGSGAAGGMGGGMIAFLDSTLQMGIESVLDTVKFDDQLEGVDMVFTGEGKIDSQSLRGKVVIGVARRTKKKEVPLIVVVGQIGDDVTEAYEEGVTGIFSINKAPIPFDEAKLQTKENLYIMMDNLIRILK